MLSVSCNLSRISPTIAKKKCNRKANGSSIYGCWGSCSSAICASDEVVIGRRTDAQNHGVYQMIKYNWRGRCRQTLVRSRRTKAVFTVEKLSSKDEKQVSVSCNDGDCESEWVGEWDEKWADNLLYMVRNGIEISLSRFSHLRMCAVLGGGSVVPSFHIEDYAILVRNVPYVVIKWISILLILRLSYYKFESLSKTFPISIGLPLCILLLILNKSTWLFNRWRMVGGKINTNWIS